jgi:hypothetical protein
MPPPCFAGLLFRCELTHGCGPPVGRRNSASRCRMARSWSFAASGASGRPEGIRPLSIVSRSTLLAARSAISSSVIIGVSSVMGEHLNSGGHRVLDSSCASSPWPKPFGAKFILLVGVAKPRHVSPDFYSAAWISSGCLVWAGAVFTSGCDGVSQIASKSANRWRPRRARCSLMAQVDDALHFGAGVSGRVFLGESADDDLGAGI